MTEELPIEPPERPDTVRAWSLLAGKVTMGFLVGCLLMPSALELASMIGGISPFKYQGF